MEYGTGATLQLLALLHVRQHIFVECMEAVAGIQ